MVDEKQMDQGAPIPPQAQEKPQPGVTHTRQAGEDLRSATYAMAGEYRSHAEGVWDDARRCVLSLQDEGKQYVRANPTKAVFIALCAGFLFGFTFRH
jgi:ElaB/YqjD/DUF883 family membrane-anchored ribosome-binding protein